MQSNREDRKHQFLSFDIQWYCIYAPNIFFCCFFLAAKKTKHRSKPNTTGAKRTQQKRNFQYCECKKVKATPVVIRVPIHLRGLFLNLKSCPRARSPSDLEVYRDHSCWWQGDTDNVDRLPSKVWGELDLFSFKSSCVRLFPKSPLHACRPKGLWFCTLPFSHLGVHTGSRQQVYVHVGYIH